MKKIIVILLLSLPIIAFSQQLQIVSLRCDNKTNPLGVENRTPLFGWEIKSEGRNIIQKAYQILVSDDSLQLLKNIGNIWDSQPLLSNTSINIPYAGKPLEPTKTYYWKVQVWDNKNNMSAWTEINSWQMGLFAKQDWENAQWIGYDQLPDANIVVPAVHGNGKKDLTAGKDLLPILRKDFAVDKAIKRATIFICGLGHFDLHLNGRKVGDHFLDPGWTKYDKEALYVPFDITAQLKKGDNALGVMLGNGFYFIPHERYRKITGAYGYPKMICRLLLEYKDGTTENIVSDDTWKTSDSPIVFSSIYGGEDYDAGAEQNGWDEPNFRAYGWKQAVIVDGPAKLNSQMADPLQVMETITPKKVTRLKDNLTYVYDLGQNASGIPSITVQGRRGDTIRIFPGELIDENGFVTQKNTGSPVYFTYILKGFGKESWQPQFTYFGFRYLQIKNIVPKGEDNTKNFPVILNLVGLHTRNAAAFAGQFACSSKLFNSTEQLIDWAIKSNMASVFTDCPHREKLGWLEEVHLMGSSIRYNYDISNLCKKVINDMKASQDQSGLVPNIAPEYVHFEDPFRDSPEWGSNAIILPWYVYQWYGDIQVLSESYDMMQRYIEYLKTKAHFNILFQGLGDWYDIGSNPPGLSQHTTKGVTATAYYYYDLTILKNIAHLLGKQADADAYSKLAVEVKDAFNMNFYNGGAKEYDHGSQTANAIAVYMKLVNPLNKDAVVGNIVKNIYNRKDSLNVLTVGDIGYRYLLRVLEDEGHSDVIYDLNSRSDVPGYGYQLAKGATALTESWQAYPTTSNNHLMLGHLSEWFYSGLAGIKPAQDAIAFNRIDICPQPVGNINWAEASYNSPYGTIISDWKVVSNVFSINVMVPVNTYATIYLPAKPNSVITESGKIMKADDYKNGKALIYIGSGKYRFEVK